MLGNYIHGYISLFFKNLSCGHHFVLDYTGVVSYYRDMKNTLNNKALRPEDGGSIPSIILYTALCGGPEFNGVKIAKPIHSIGFSQEGTGPDLGQQFDWYDNTFVVVKLGVQNWQGRSSFTALAVANA